MITSLRLNLNQLKSSYKLGNATMVKKVGLYVFHTSQLVRSHRRYRKKIVVVCEEPETLDAGALHRVVGRTESAGEEGAALCAEAERARSDERSAAPLNVVRREQPVPDRRLEKINKKVSNEVISFSLLWNTCLLHCLFYRPSA